MKLSEKSKPELPARKDPKHKESKTSAQSDERKKLDKQSSIEEIEKRVKKSSLLSSVRYKIYFLIRKSHQQLSGISPSRGTCRRPPGRTCGRRPRRAGRPSGSWRERSATSAVTAEAGSGRTGSIRNITTPAPCSGVGVRSPAPRGGAGRRPGWGRGGRGRRWPSSLVTSGRRPTRTISARVQRKLDRNIIKTKSIIKSTINGTKMTITSLTSNHVMNL